MNFLKTTISVLLMTSIFFIGDANAQLNVTSEGNVAIGTTSATSYQLRVYNNGESYTAHLGNYFSTTGTKYGLYNYTGSQGTGTKYGLYNTTYQNSGSTRQTRGIYTYVYPNGSGAGYGLYANVSSAGSGTKYGVYSTVNGGAGWAGYFVGDVNVTGSISLMAPTPGQTQKKANVSNAIAKIKGLNAISFEQTEVKGRTRTKYSLDMDALKNTLPELVYEVEQPAEDQELIEGEEPAENVKAKATMGTAVDYNGLIPVLVQAIKEQQAQIATLEQKIKAIQK